MYSIMCGGWGRQSVSVLLLDKPRADVNLQLHNEYSAVAEFEDKNILWPITNCGSEYILSYIGGWIVSFST